MAKHTQFVNVDVDVRTLRDPAPLVRAFDAAGLSALTAPVHGSDGAWFVNFELAREDLSLEATVSALVDGIEALTGEAREIWYVSTLRELHLGFEVGTEPRTFTDVLSSATLARAVAAGMSLRITIDPPDRDER